MQDIILSKVEKVTTSFNETQKRINELRAELGELEKELFRYQGEYRLLMEMSEGENNVRDDGLISSDNLA